MTDPHIWGKVADDFAPPPHEFQPIEGPMYIGVTGDGEPWGLFVLVPHTSTIVEVHTCLLPICWGVNAYEAALGFAEWIWRNTQFDSLITFVPVNNRLALRFAKVSGMVEVGRLPKSFRKNGVLHDQILLSLERP